MFYSKFYSSPVGGLTLASDGENIVGLWIADQKYYLATLPEKPVEDDSVAALKKAVKWLDRYFSGEKPPITGLPLAPFGSSFRQSVWNLLQEIPYGEVETYGNIAKKMALRMNKEKMSAQAIGGAVGRNPISIIIPCHRVVGSNGRLTGYAGGIETKLKLLELEGVDMRRLSLPVSGADIIKNPI